MDRRGFIKRGGIITAGAIVPFSLPILSPKKVNDQYYILYDPVNQELECRTAYVLTKWTPKGPIIERVNVYK